MKWLISRPPLFYLATYILTIIGFATGYTFMPNNFYQSTRQLERYTTTKVRLNDKLSNFLLEDLTNNLRKQFLIRNNFDSVKILEDSIFFHIDDFNATDIVYYDNKIVFTVQGHYYTWGAQCPTYMKLSTNLENISTWGGKKEVWMSFHYEESTERIFPSLLGLPINANDSLITSLFLSNNKETQREINTPINRIRYVLQSNESAAYKEKLIRFIFLKEIRKDTGVIFVKFHDNYAPEKDRSRLGFTFPVSESFNLNLKSFALGLSNKPVESNDWLNLFIKMLYFSCITIATLGYGDIVPITTLARSLTALEVILGVILIGLFLNSLAQRIRIKST